MKSAPLLCFYCTLLHLLLNECTLDKVSIDAVASCGQTSTQHDLDDFLCRRQLQHGRQ